MLPEARCGLEDVELIDYCEVKQRTRSRLIHALVGWPAKGQSKFTFRVLGHDTSRAVLTTSAAYDRSPSSVGISSPGTSTSALACVSLCRSSGNQKHDRLSRICYFPEYSKPLLSAHLAGNNQTITPSLERGQRLGSIDSKVELFALAYPYITCTQQRCSLQDEIFLSTRANRRDYSNFIIFLDDG